MATGLKPVLEHLQQAGEGLPDRQLLDRFLDARDEAAFAALVRRHGAMVLGVCRRVLHDFHEAEDAFQATFLVLAAKAPSLVVHESLGCWLYGVAHRTALQASVLSARRRARERPMNDLPHPEVAAAEARDWLPLLDRELSLLPEKYRAAIVVCDLEGRTRREAARLLGIAEGTLSSRLARGRTLLARRLAGRGVALSGGGLAAALAHGAASASVPAALVSSTARAAVLVAAGQLAGATPAVLLMRGVMKAMLLKTLRLGVGAVVVLVALGAVGFGYLAGGGPGSAQAAPLDKVADSHGDPLPAGALARLGTTRLRHAADVTFVGFGPGRNTLLTAGQDGTIRLWDLAGRKEICRFALPSPIPVKSPQGKKQAPQHITLTQSMAGGGGTGDFRVALSSDGKTLAATRGNAIQLWEVESGKELRRIQGPAGGLMGLLFSPDGRTLAGRAGNGDLFLWVAGTGKQTHHIKAPQGPGRYEVALVIGGGGGASATAATMAFTPDGKTLAAAVTDYEQQKAVRSIKFWDVASGKELRKIQPPKGAGVGAVALAPDGKLLAYISDYITRLCAVDTGKEVRQLKTGGNAVGLAFVGDSRTLAGRGTNARLRLWDTQTGKELHELSEAELPRQADGLVPIGGDFVVLPEVQTLAISADGKRIAAAAGRTARLWDAASGKELLLLNGHWRAPTAIRVSPDGKTVVSWGSDRVVRRWEAATGKPLGAFPAPPRTTVAAFSPDGRVVALANADNSIRLHDTSTGKEVRRLKGQLGSIAALGFAPEGKVLASRSGSVIRLWDVARGVELRQLNAKRKERPNHHLLTELSIPFPARTSSGTGPGLAFSPDGRMVVVTREAASAPGKTLVLIDTTTGKELRKIESPRPIASFTLSPDGRTLAAENTDRTITLWELATGKEQGHLRAGGARLGKTIAPGPRPNAGLADLVVGVLDVGGDSSAPGGPVGVSFSPDGRALAVRGADGAVHVWDVNAGKEISPFKGQGGRVETVSFAPGGKALASGASDTTIVLWDAARLFKELSKPQSTQLAAAEVEALWGKLAGEDATQARQSVLKLAAAPRQAATFLGQRLKPAARVDPKKITGWIADLDSEKFKVRQAAYANLLKVSEQALPALRKTLASGPQLETRKRLEELVDRLTRDTLTTEQLQLVRAVEALEKMGTTEAAQLLRALAGGAPGALPTREAQAALSRLAAR